MNRTLEQILETGPYHELEIEILKANDPNTEFRTLKTILCTEPQNELERQWVYANKVRNGEVPTEHWHVIQGKQKRRPRVISEDEDE